MNPSDNPDNPDVLAGFTFLGQFIDHDITFDPTSSLERQNDPESIENFRTPMLELDSVYGSGRAVTPHLYDATTGRNKFLLEKLTPSDAASPDDLPRNSQNTALVGDPRNDENVIIAQLHLAFLKFHNAVIDKIVTDGNVDPTRTFTEAQRLVRWHYQWIVLHEYLPHIVDQQVIHDILTNGPTFYSPHREPFIPVEFAVAAFRFGHSQIRPRYRVNDGFTAPLFDANQGPANPDPNDLSGGKRAPRRFVQWRNFFTIDASMPQVSKRIDTSLSAPLFQLPFIPPNVPGNPSALAQRTLLRHLTFSLPSGQAVANAMGVKPLAPDDLADIAALGLAISTPLWFYILREAHKQAGGIKLGPVGGRIVAEVLIGLLQGDPASFVRQAPQWTPTLGTRGTFSMADLLKFAGVA
jgi:hypothetical protein